MSLRHGLFFAPLVSLLLCGWACSESPSAGAPTRADAATINDAGAPHLDAEVLVYGEMAMVPAGGFWMGCSGDDPGWCGLSAPFTCCQPSERPHHYVEVPTFWIDRTEASISAYGECVDAGVCRRGGESAGCNWGEREQRANHPVSCVDFEQARTFCEWRSRRLCTEAEWEKAAVGGCEFNGGEQRCRSQTRYHPWGRATPNCDLANMHIYGEQGEGLPGCGTNASSPVGSRPLGQSPYGVHDMVGNAYEYVQDCRHYSYVGAPTDGSAWTTDCESLIPGATRGGDWRTPAVYLRSSLRWSERPREECCGIRCCASEAPP